MQILRIVLLLGLIFALNLFVLKKMKFKGRKIVIVVVNIILLSFLNYPYETQFITFKSPEAAFKYVNPGNEPSIVIEGKESAFIVLEKSGSYVASFYKKVDNGWKATQNYGGSTIKSNAEDYFNDHYIMTIYQYQKTKDYYIGISSDLKELDVSDNLDSDFIPYKKCFKYKSEEFCNYHYYAYIYDFNEEYEVTIDGKKAELRFNR